MLKKIPVLLIILLSVLKGYSLVTDTTRYGLFGKVVTYRAAEEPESVVLFVSGDGGWNQGVVEMARILAQQGAFVAGIDIVRYYAALKKTGKECYYPASDLENLSIYLQKKYHLKGYRKPIVVGYSSGATLAYAVLAQAPANTFKGAISLGFCPDIEIDKPLCEGAGLKSRVLKPGKSFYLDRESSLPAPIRVLQGLIDQVCAPEPTLEYFKGVPNAEVISLPKVGHGFSVQKNWVPQFLEAYKSIQETLPMFEQHRQVKPSAEGGTQMYQEIAQLPLLVYPAEADPRAPMVVMISGDGGWTSWDESLAREFTDRHIPVVALDAQKYFWDAKDPQQVASDLQKVATYYLDLWKKEQFYLVGYSFGADIVPFVAARLKQPLSGQLLRLVLLSPDPKGDFEIHVADMLNMDSSSDTYDVPGELKKLKNLDILCIFGESEDVSDRQPFQLNSVRVELLPGSHHYGNRFADLVSCILSP